MHRKVVIKVMSFGQCVMCDMTKLHACRRLGVYVEGCPNGSFSWEKSVKDNILLQKESHTFRSCRWPVLSCCTGQFDVFDHLCPCSSKVATWKRRQGCYTINSCVERGILENAVSKLARKIHDPHPLFHMATLWTRLKRWAFCRARWCSRWDQLQERKRERSLSSKTLAQDHGTKSPCNVHTVGHQTFMSPSALFWSGAKP